MRNKVVALAAVLVAGGLAAGGVAVAAPGSDARGQSGRGTIKAAPEPDNSVTFVCDGTAQKLTRTRVNDAPVVFGETAGFVQLPIAVTIAGPTTSSDAVNVTFSAETQLRGAGTDQFDWSELQVRRNGVPLPPVGGPGDPLAFTGDDTYGSNAAQFCGRIGRGPQTYTVWQKIVDNGTNGALSVWYDDMTLRVEQSQ